MRSRMIERINMAEPAREAAAEIMVLVEGIWKFLRSMAFTD